MGEGRGSFEDEEPEGLMLGKAGSASGGSLHHPSSLDYPELPTLPSLCPSGEYHDCNGRALHLSTELPSELSREDSTDEDLDDVSKQTYGCKTNTILHGWFVSAGLGRNVFF